MITQARELFEVVQKCSLDDWDGYGGKAIKNSAAMEAWNFLKHIPKHIEQPSIVPEPCGDLGLEWRRKDSKNVLIVSFPGNNTLNYSGLFMADGETILGEEKLSRITQEKIIAILESKFHRQDN
jgi:hypothetical protein